MKTKNINYQAENNKFVFKDYPNLKLGLSTNSFQKAITFNIPGITEIIEYASKEGYQFLEIRDVLADLAIEDCKALAGVAKKENIEIIYVIGVHPLDSGFNEVFERGLANTSLFQGPGFMRTLISNPVFDPDVSKKGWTKEEFAKLTRICENCAAKAKAKKIKFIVENLNEAFFGDNLTYFGLADFLNQTTETNFQLDIGNLFRNTTRVKNDPDKVMKFLSTLGKRWVETHLKTIQGGEPQPILTDNPLPVERIVDLMGKRNIPYVMLELDTVADKQQCFDNHAACIRFLKDKGILKK